MSKSRQGIFSDCLTAQIIRITALFSAILNVKSSSSVLIYFIWKPRNNISKHLSISF